MKHLTIMTLAAIALCGCQPNIIKDPNIVGGPVFWRAAGWSAWALPGAVVLNRPSAVEQTVTISEAGAHNLTFRVLAKKGDPMLTVTGDFERVIGQVPVGDSQTTIMIERTGTYCIGIGTLGDPSGDRSRVVLGRIDLHRVGSAAHLAP